MNTREAPRPDVIADVQVYAGEHLLMVTDWPRAQRAVKALAERGRTWRLMYADVCLAQS